VDDQERVGRFAYTGFEEAVMLALSTVKVRAGAPFATAPAKAGETRKPMTTIDPKIFLTMAIRDN
jgi:hypothetical protein